jgi:hypothetical protein
MPHVSQNGYQYYSIHDIVNIRTNVDLPVPEYFRVDLSDMSGPIDIDVIEESTLLPFSENEMYRCSIFFMGHDEHRLAIDYRLPLLNVKLLIENLSGNTRISFTKGFKRFGDLTNLFNTVLLFKFIQSGHTFVHSGCISSGEDCHLISGMRDTGKTSTVLSIVDGRDKKFMSDDLTIISGDGRAYSYPTSVGISPYTLTGKIVDHKHPKWKKWIAKHQLLLFGLEAVVNFEISKRIDISEKFISKTGKINNVFLLRSSKDNRISKIDSSVAVQKLLMTTTELIDPFRIYSLNFYSYYTGFDSANIFELEKKIIEDAMTNSNCYEVCANDVDGFHRLIQNEVEL